VGGVIDRCAAFEHNETSPGIFSTAIEDVAHVSMLTAASGPTIGAATDRGAAKP